jgi:hypothetical protein
MDSRFHLKIEFKIYGRTFNWEPSLNWTADPCECDRRIVEFFVRCHDEAFADWEEKRHQERAEADAAERERKERAELARLRAKYPDV